MSAPAVVTDSLGRPLRDLVVGDRVRHESDDYGQGPPNGTVLESRNPITDSYQVRWDDGGVDGYRRLQLVAPDDPPEYPDEEQASTDRGIAAMDPHNDPPDPTLPRVKMTCKTCGSEDVIGDAYAAWDKHAQRWEISGDVFDKGAYCNACDGETRIVETPL